MAASSSLFIVACKLLVFVYRCNTGILILNLLFSCFRVSYSCWMTFFKENSEAMDNSILRSSQYQPSSARKPRNPLTDSVLFGPSTTSGANTSVQDILSPGFSNTTRLSIVNTPGFHAEKYVSLHYPLLIHF